WRAGYSGGTGPGVHPSDLCEVIRRRMRPGWSLAFDAGDFVQWPRVTLPALNPGGWLRVGLMGTLGAAVPVANGAQSARPEATVICFVGDGGFGYYGFEFHTAVRYQLPVKFIVGNDGYWGTERRLQASHYPAAPASPVSLGDVPYHLFARMFGCFGEEVRDERDLDAAVGALLDTSGPALLNVITRSVGAPSAHG
ncbi:MAG: thiamine pyrophosphate-dependent enzyme, partial [Mycobacteriales bacterium]